MKEGAQIGKNLVPSLMTEQLAETGVDQWRVQNKAVKELMELYDWFEPMVVIIAKGVVKTAAWGLMARVIIGAILSLSDLATDLVILREFWVGGEETLLFRNAQMISLLISLLCQLLVVFLQYRERGALRIMREAMIVVFGLKAPVDAYRVASGAEQEKGTQFEPMIEMTYHKGIELITESTPGIIIQLSAVLKTVDGGSGSVTTAAYISLIISLLTTGFVSASISYDLDTNPQKRLIKPDFYGFVPDSARRRAAMFLNMILISGLLVLLKSGFLVCLGALGGMRYVWYFLGADILIYLGYKAIRGDLTYFLPVKERWLSVIVTVLLRVFVKLILDFTGCFHFRHPYEAGGAYFTMNYFSPVVTMASLVFLMEEGGTLGNLGKETELIMKHLAIYGGLSLFVLSCTLLILMEKTYRRTFYSIETGGQLTRRMFLAGDDKLKSEVFGCHTDHWNPIVDSVKEWVVSGWKRWNDEKPEWFSDRWIARVPEELIPGRRHIERKGNFEDGEERISESVSESDSSSSQMRRRSIKIIPFSATRGIRISKG